MHNGTRPLRDFLRRTCPPLLRTWGRLLLQRSERAKLIREIKICKAQDSLIGAEYDSSTPRLIVYIVDGADWVSGKEHISGGLLSIASLFEETKKLRRLHGCQVIMVTLNSTALILRHTQFENNITVFRLSQVFSYFDQLNSLLIHVPEMLIPDFLAEIRTHLGSRRKPIPKFHINILNQNILFMPPPSVAEQLKGIAGKVTMTTAHVRYCTEEVAKRYGVSVHNLSSPDCPENFKSVPYEEKTNLMIVSPDPHPMRDEILDTIQRELPSLRLQIIRNLTYEEYKQTIGTAKWSLTFGEGLDGYFAETIYSGGVGFAVFNDDFFPEEFAALPTVFASYDTMRRKLPSMLRELDNTINFRDCHSAELALLQKYYSRGEYLENIKRFYDGEYDIRYGGAGQTFRSCLAGR